jgi:hypothetical protein
LGGHSGVGEGRWGQEGHQTRAKQCIHVSKYHECPVNVNTFTIS